jgi:hypothetical protein
LEILGILLAFPGSARDSNFLSKREKLVLGKLLDPFTNTLDFRNKTIKRCDG